MTCPACERAEKDAHTVFYESRCLGCEARMLAHSPEAHSRAAAPDALRARMFATWPDMENYRRGRVAVWAWIKRLEASDAD